MHKNLCTDWFVYAEIIWIWQCVLFFLPWTWFHPLVHCVVMLATSLCCAVFFCCCCCWFVFREVNFLVAQLNVSFPLTLLRRQEKYHWTGLSSLYVNYTNMISELYQHMYSYTFCKSYELWKMSTVLSTYWELLIASPHKPLCLKKMRTTFTTAFLILTQQSWILTTIIQHYILNLSHPHLYLKFQVHLIGLPQCDIQILYGLPIDNGIRQCVNSSWTGIFKNKLVVHG